MDGDGMVILIVALVCLFLGATYLIGCFIRVDSPAFIDRAAGNEKKVAKLHSLQEAWDRLGKFRQFLASSSNYLIMGVGLLLIWYDQRFSGYYLAALALFAVNMAGLSKVQKYARATLDESSPGGSEVLVVIERQIWICVSFGVVYALVATGAYERLWASLAH